MNSLAEGKAYATSPVTEMWPKSTPPLIPLARLLLRELEVWVAVSFFRAWREM